MLLYYLRVFLYTSISFHLSCPMITAVSVEASTPRVPSRPCQGEAQYSAARMRAPLNGLLARITLVTPLRPHTASCSTNNLSEDTERKYSTQFPPKNLLGKIIFPNVIKVELKGQTAAQNLVLSGIILMPVQDFIKESRWEFNDVMFYVGGKMQQHSLWELCDDYICIFWWQCEHFRLIYLWLWQFKTFQVFENSLFWKSFVINHIMRTLRLDELCIFPSAFYKGHKIYYILYLGSRLEVRICFGM